MLYAISSIALVIVSITMLCRANDIRHRGGWHWNTRMAGFILAGFAPWGVIAYDDVGFYECVMRVGVALVFLTTPHLPPWWKFISKGEKA